MAGYGDKPFGLRDIKITNIGGSSQEDLPNAMTLNFNERIRSGEMSGDDRIVSVVAQPEALEGSFSAGGISLEAWAIMTGRTASESGSTPNRILSMVASADDDFPYFKIYGKSIGDVSSDDVHVLLYKCKLTTAPQGQFQEGEFFVTEANVLAIDDGSNGIWKIIQNETAAALPSS